MRAGGPARFYFLIPLFFLHFLTCTLFHSRFYILFCGAIIYAGVSRCWFTWMGWLLELLVYWWSSQKSLKKSWGNISQLYFSTLNIHVIRWSLFSFFPTPLEFEARADLFLLACRSYTGEGLDLLCHEGCDAVMHREDANPAELLPCLLDLVLQRGSGG